MAETNKISVEKALEKIRQDELRDTAGGERDEKMETMRREIERMRAQRSRLGPNPRKGE